MTRIYLLTALLGIIPVSELRGAIPYAYFNGVPMWLAFILGVLSNALVPFIGFVFLATLHRLLDKWKFYHNLFEKTVQRARSKVSDKVGKYGLLGLMLFVAIPLPITGAWTGTIGAWVMGLDRKKSILFILLGVLVAGIVVSAVVATGAGIASLFTKQVNI
ncbi:MAG: small multi-drug export protein [Spirochaetales bacterium]|nr:small multi-drug export protein [Spirochaetales bacterium]MBQ7508276.1 small multi-drug export protein [Spirochaetales bacterium]